MPAIRFAAVLMVLASPAVFAPLLVRARGRIPRSVWRLFAVFVCLLPLAAPFEFVGIAGPRLTMPIAILGGIVMIKAIDWLAAPRHESDLVRVRLALSFWPAPEIEDVLVPIQNRHRRISTAWRRLAAGVPCLVAGLAMAAGGHFLTLPDRSIWLDSLFKCVEIYLLASGSNHLLVAAFATAGYRVTDGFRYPILAHSVLDFWSRYNVWIHRWLKKHVFEPIGRRRRRPVIGILAVFAVSGLLHEYLMVPVAPDLLGWQFTFSGLHGVGAIGGTWLGRKYRAKAGRGVPRSLAIAATLGFVLATAPIFIHCMDRIVDLHRDVGGWVLTMVGQDQRHSDTPPPAPRVTTHMVDRDDCDLVIVDTIDDGVGEPSGQGEPQILEDFAIERWHATNDLEGFFDAKHKVVAQSQTLIIVPRLGLDQVIIRLGADNQRQTHREEPCKHALTSSQGEPTLGLSRWASRRCCKSSI
jgi:MBOAT, membrane-bound O-acyltransferase family